MESVEEITWNNHRYKLRHSLSDVSTSIGSNSSVAYPYFEPITLLHDDNLAELCFSSDFAKKLVGFVEEVLTNPTYRLLFILFVFGIPLLSSFAIKFIISEYVIVVALIAIPINFSILSIYNRKIVLALLQSFEVMYLILNVLCWAISLAIMLNDVRMIIVFPGAFVFISVVFIDAVPRNLRSDNFLIVIYCVILATIIMTQISIFLDWIPYQNAYFTIFGNDKIVFSVGSVFSTCFGNIMILIAKNVVKIKLYPNCFCILSSRVAEYFDARSNLSSNENIEAPVFDQKSPSVQLSDIRVLS